MDKIYNIKYVDASYSYEESINQTKLDLFEAYGYVEKNKNNIVITFIKKHGISEEKQNHDKEVNIINGLVIPDTSLASISSAYKTNILDNIKINYAVSVTWRDVVHVENLPRYDCSVMYTEGILVKIESDYVILKDPKTIRTYPTPVKNHPGSGLPTYLVIPISFITDIEVVK
ncbi:MAG: hypothetical protein LiPW30_558 [Parcubacteria group bacterium LiPW_30]|nr:MAG: hypothetical protein LiPW30_558 [Parcubacteria group bacterium LiPW_30]